MKAVIQRVTSSSVKVSGKEIGKINRGLNVLLGVKIGDEEKDAEYLAGKIMRLRIFPDENNKMNMSIQEIKGELLVISQFTLYADCKKGNRPSFTKSADAHDAASLYSYFIEYIENNYKMKVQKGLFKADMVVSIENDGPVTIVLESPVTNE